MCSHHTAVTTSTPAVRMGSAAVASARTTRPGRRTRRAAASPPRWPAPALCPAVRPPPLRGQQRDRGYGGDPLRAATCGRPQQQRERHRERRRSAAPVRPRQACTECPELHSRALRPISDSAAVEFGRRSAIRAAKRCHWRSLVRCRFPAQQPATGSGARPTPRRRAGNRPLPTGLDRPSSQHPFGGRHPAGLRVELHRNAQCPRQRLVLRLGDVMRIATVQHPDV